MKQKKFMVWICALAVLAVVLTWFLRPISLIRHKDFEVLSVSYCDGDNHYSITGEIDLEQVGQILANAQCRRRIEPMLWPGYRTQQLRYDITIFYPKTHDHVNIYLGLPDEAGEDSMMNKAYCNNSGIFNFCWRILDPDRLIDALDKLH